MVRRIPKRFFSQKFFSLPIARKIFIRRKLERESKELLGEVKKLANDIHALHRSVLSPSGLKKTDAIKKLQTILVRRRNLEQRSFKFCDMAEKYFTSFNAFMPQTSLTPENMNPIEMKLHKFGKGLDECSKFLPVLEKDIQLIKR